MKVRASPGNDNVVLEVRRGEAAGIALPEIRLKKILVPTDFSDCSRKALHYATSLGRQFNAEILLLHVVEPLTVPPEMLAGLGSLNGQMREAAAKRLSEWRKELPSPASVKTNVRDGNSFREIIRAADEINADLIIIGTHGRSALKQLLMGSTAERVLRHAPCPVLIVREREHDFVAESETTAAKDRLKGGPYGDAVKEKRSRKSEAVLRR